MLESYKTVGDNAFYSYVIDRSKFLGYAYSVGSKEEIKVHLAALKKEHSFARHICYGYVLEDIQKSSDDGEPKGTAGLPILETIKKAGLNFTLLAVVRYFGGIKLGAGGLNRAYSHTASMTLCEAEIINMSLMGVYSIELSFSEAAKIQILRSGIELSRSYSDKVHLELATASKDNLKKELSVILQTNIEMIFLEEKYVRD